MFWDLGVPSDLYGHPKRGPAAVQTFKDFGYDGIAVSETVTGKVSSKSSIKLPPKSAASISLSGPRPFALKSRLHVVLDDLQQVHSLSSNNACIQSYDLISIRPTSEKLFYQCCQSIDCDIISLDLSDRLSFQLKFPAVNSAISRGIFFEISYGPLIADSASRHHILSNCMNLVRVTKGKNLILTSSVLGALSIRNPYDVMNLCALIGLTQAQAHAAISSNPQAAILHAEIRRTAQGVCAAINATDPSIPKHLQWIMDDM